MSAEWGVWAMRSSGSVLGPAEAWVKCTIDGQKLAWTGSEEAAREYAAHQNANVYSKNVSYEARRYG
jgi:hypothetical protein